MPVIFSNPQFPNQVGPSPFSQAESTQLNYGEMLREITSVNPNVDPMIAGRWINNYYRNIVKKRTWYGLKVRGQIGVPTVYSTGQALFTQGSFIVQGTGTAWVTGFVGLQIRPNFNSAYQTITHVNVATQQITLDMPFAQPTIGAGGYQIIQAYVTLGANCKRLMWATNQLFGWPMDVDTKVESINAWDTWRQNLGWPRVMAKRPATPDGQLQVEIWPTPVAAQVFPFEAYTEPLNLVNESDTVLAWIPTDVIVAGAKSEAYLHGGRKSDYYDPSTAATLRAEYKAAVAEAELADENLEVQDVTWDYGWENGGLSSGVGSTWSQMHD